MRNKWNGLVPKLLQRIRLGTNNVWQQARAEALPHWDRRAGKGSKGAQGGAGSLQEDPAQGMRIGWHPCVHRL